MPSGPLTASLSMDWNVFREVEKACNEWVEKGNDHPTSQGNKANRRNWVTTRIYGAAPKTNVTTTSKVDNLRKLALPDGSKNQSQDELERLPDS